MTITAKLSRNNIITILNVFSCGVLGAALGWYTLSISLHNITPGNGQKAPKPDAAFVLPPYPSAPAAAEQEPVLTDPADLRVWEMTARQPLPPRKEPLTAPGWKIVGVTSVGNEKNVLLLFDKQTEIEIRKVGEQLPGGAKIIQISQDHLRIFLNGQFMKLDLLKQ